MCLLNVFLFLFFCFVLGFGGLRVVFAARLCSYVCDGVCVYLYFFYLCCHQSKQCCTYIFAVVIKRVCIYVCTDLHTPAFSCKCLTHICMYVFLSVYVKQ